MYKIMVAAKDAAGKPHVVPVGVCGLTSIDMVNRRAEFSIYTAPAYHGTGFGIQGLRCLLQHGFQNLGMHTIWGEVFDGNPALEKFEALGFRREGLREDFYMRDGEFIDAHIIAVRDGEWA